MSTGGRVLRRWRKLKGVGCCESAGVSEREPRLSAVVGLLPAVELSPP